MKEKSGKERITELTAVLLMSVSMLIFMLIAGTSLTYASSWDHYRGGAENNAVVDFSTPTEIRYTKSVWVHNFSESADGMSGWNFTPDVPIIVDGEIVTTSYKKILKMDADTGKIIQSGDLSAAVNWGYTALTYDRLSDGTGVFFCPLAGGQLQAVNAETLESMWVFKAKEKNSDGTYRWGLTVEKDRKPDEEVDAEDLTEDGTVLVDSAVHQSLSPAVYSDGIVYTGFFGGAYDFYDYYIAVAAEAVTVGGKSYEPGELIWKYKSKGGFYWNGAIAVGNAIIVGTQDGVNNNDVTGAMSTVKADSHILALDKKTGKPVSDILLHDAGDICSGIVWDREGTGRIYWSSCTGMIHSAAVDTATGEISDVKSAYLEGFDEEGNPVQSLTVNTPVIYGGKVYLGYKPKKGAYGYFAAYDAGTLENVFRAPIKGYPKGSPVLTTAYLEDTGYLYAYTSIYQEPGGLQVIKFLQDSKPAELPDSTQQNASGEPAGEEGASQDGSGAEQEEQGERSPEEKAYDVTVSDLFGAIGHEQYCASNVIADDKGQLYYKNDSNVIFAVGKGEEVILGKGENLKVTASGAKITARVDKDAGANGYRILYRLNNKGGFTAVDSESNKSTFPVLTSKKPSAIVTVRVRPEYVDAAKAVYGDYSEDATIYAAYSTIKSLTAAKKAFTVKFDKHSQADGYEIQYSLKKSMGSAKTLKKKGYSTVKYKVSGLKAKKKYYVRVRSYRTYDGKKYYGTWSKVKAVKTK